ncbi:AbiV family abortive infection protein [Ancylobacter dichloromethanicus]|uniref:AbiV family abortive infection protein n=1 Tax=Ancylobacter dichloromethanicus TaxID=518825 RepID=UPI001FE70F6D|nr:AbiV family abortive infection protein [Ancylobacter dichloromethanicus]
MDGANRRRNQSSNKLHRAIRASIDNAWRLHEETYDLEFRTPCATRYVLLIIAQEEAAKAFLLYLISEEIVPLTAAVRRAINDHACKHLVGMIMDYMIMHWEEIEELNAIINRDFELGNNLPNDVGSALEILRYEKIGRWTVNNWVWAEDPAYDREALKLADGKRDRRKQDALYVRIGADGQLASTPAVITQTEVATELERASRYINFAEALTTAEERHGFNKDRFEKVMAALKLLFKPNEGAASVAP